MKYAILTTVGLVVLFFGVYFGLKIWHSSGTIQVATTTLDTGASSPADTSSWKTASDTANGATFKYPANFGTTYITAFDWPPTVQVINGPLKCVEAGATAARAGKTEKKTINGTQYCVTTESEGAAGSTYNQYAYAFEKGAKVVILTFTIRLPQCGNYNDPEKSACTTEQASFNLDNLISNVANTLTLSGSQTQAS